VLGRLVASWAVSFALAKSAFGQGAVGGDERGDGLTIMGGCSGKIGNCFNGVLQLDVIVLLVVGGARSCASSIPEFAVGFRESTFDLIPSFVGAATAFAKFAVFNKHTSHMHELKSVVRDLFGGVWREAGGSVVNTIFDLIK
jgi:hypothetical protein